MADFTRTSGARRATDGSSAKTSPAPEPRELLDNLRKRMTDVSLYVFAVILPVVVIGSLYRAVDGGFKPVMFFHLFAAVTVILLALLRRRIDYRLRAYVVVLIMYVGGIWGLLTWGLLSGGNLLLSSCCLFATLLLGTRHGVVMLVAVTLSWCALTWRAYTGQMAWDEALATYAVTHPAWVAGLLGSNLFTLLPLLAISYVERALMEKASESLSHSRALERAHAVTLREMTFTTAIIDGLPGLFYLIDRSGCLVRWNTAFEEYFGIDHAHAHGAQVLDLIPATIRERAAEILESGFVTGELETELALPNRDGGVADIYLTGTRFVREGEEFLLGVGLDVTRQRAMELEHRRLATVVEQTDVGIGIMDSHGTMVYINPAFERLTGFGLREAAAGGMGLLASGVHEPVIYDTIWDTISGGGVWRGRLVERCKDGGLITFDAIFSPIRDDEEITWGYVGVRRDVTIQIQMERELHQSQRLNEIGTLAGGIAHDFNNILGAIMGYTELLQEHAPLETDEQREWLTSISGASIRARDLVRQILLFSRQSPQERRPCDFGEITHEALNLVRSTLPKSVEIQERRCAEGLSVFADGTQLHQVIMNLCINAWHAMKETGGVITVSLRTAEVSEAEPTIPIPPGTYAELVVTDSGSGIAPTDMERIFDPFFTTKPPGEGTGLGLSVVHGIITDHGGLIRVESVPGKGTTFTILLPRYEAVPSGQISAERPAAAGTECIVLIDDEVSLLGVYSRMLTSLGYRVLVHDNPSLALEWIGANISTVDLVVTDYSMPEMNGIEFCGELRRLGVACPVILCTGYLGEAPEAVLETCCVATVLQKPIGLRQLGASVREALDRRPEHV